MKGKVNPLREAVVRLRIYGRGARRRSVAAIIDSGYSGALTLPSALIRSLRLPRSGRSATELADGSIVTFDVYAGTVLFGRRRIAVDIDEAQTVPLIGMELLDGCELIIRVEPGGSVRIRPLRTVPRKRSG